MVPGTALGRPAISSRINPSSFSVACTIGRTVTTKSYDAIPKGDLGKLKEYSVIFTNRSLNLMSDPFQKIMSDLNGLLKDTYNANKVAIIPG
jgi:hypothetical protein